MSTQEEEDKEHELTKDLHESAVRLDEIVHEVQVIEHETLTIKTRIVKVLIKLKNWILCSSSCLKTSTKSEK